MADSQVHTYRQKEINDVMQSVKGTADGLIDRGQTVLDRFVPPQQRQQIWSRMQAFANHRPKLTAFLLSQLALSGIPLILFLTFTVVTFIFSLVVGLLLGLLGALLFTAFAVGVALFFVVPTLFVTTTAATFMFIWGVVGYYLFQWLNSGAPVEQSKAIGQKLDNATGGRLQPLIEDAKKRVDSYTPKRSDIENKVHSRAESSPPTNPKKLEVKAEEKGAISPEDPANGFTVLPDQVEEPFDQLDLEKMRRIGDGVKADTPIKLEPNRYQEPEVTGSG